MKRQFQIPDWLTNAVSQSLKSRGVALTDSKRIADCVLKMSDFYIAQPASATPWKETWCQIAQLAYFLPLNFLRSQSVLMEAKARNFPFQSTELLDFGSGLGAGSLPWLSDAHPDKTVYVERSSEAQKIHRELLAVSPASRQEAHWISEKEIKTSRTRTALFSYSLTELTALPAWIYECQSLIWIEPSTREDGRLLLQRRKDLLTKGFSAWAPCPHQQGCPLFEGSKTDWCHDRIFFDRPTWFQDIEKYLPMKNSTLTFSYLLASKAKAPEISQWRTVGDQLEEKGKTRQMICRGPEREFVSWLHRDGDAPEVPRGVLLEPPAQFEQKGTEIRIPR